MSCTPVISSPWRSTPLLMQSARSSPGNMMETRFADTVTAAAMTSQGSGENAVLPFTSGRKTRDLLVRRAVHPPDRIEVREPRDEADPLEQREPRERPDALPSGVEDRPQQVAARG